MAKKKATTRAGFRALARKSLGVIKNNWKLLGGVTIIYAALYFIFAEGLTAIDISTIKSDIETNFEYDPDSLSGQLLLTGAVFEAAGSLNEVGSAYMFFISTFTVLALIWSLRHIWSKQKTTVREAYYKSMYPIVPFLVLIGIAILQLIPLVVGSFILTTGVQNDVFVGGVEIFLAATLLLAVPAVISFAMLINTLFAFIIITIPDMQPMEAYRSAKDLLKKKKAYVTRLVLSWMVLLFLMFGLVLLLTIITVPAAASIVGLVATVLVLPMLVTFLYATYRSLLDE